MTASTSRRRVYTAADVARWAQSISDGVLGAEFRERHGLPVNQARQSAARLGLELPEATNVGRMRDAKTPPGERSTMWFPTRGGRRRRMT
jgi:hypothetical protein